MKLEKIPFKQFITLQRGYDLPISKIEEGDFPVIGSTGIIGFHNKAKIKSPGVVTGRSGTIGLVHHINMPYWPHNTSLWVKDFKGNNIKYVYYKLKILNLERFNGGASVPTLNRNTLDNLIISVHDKNAQDVIAHILSTYDDLIEINQKRIQLLEEAARLLYREWFVYFRFPGHENIKIVDGIPEGWEKKSLSEIVTTQYGYTEAATQDKIGPKFLRGKDINKSSYIDWNSVPYCSDKKLDFNKYYLSPGDILIIRMADPGKIGIVEKEIKAIFASYLVRLKIIDKNIPPYFLFYSLVSNRYQGYINGASTGSTRKSASAKLMVSYALLIPKKEIINSFNEQMIQLRKSINILLEQNQKLTQARDLLLPRLMSGNIDVSEFDEGNKPLESEVEKIVN